MAIEAVNRRTRGLRSRPSDDASGIVALLGGLDWILVAAVLAAVGYGVWAIGGITLHDPGGSASSRQGLYAAVGLVLMVVVMVIDPSVYRRLGGGISIALTGVMATVLVFGVATRGSKRWIDIGFFTFQPSEFGKVLLVLGLASYVAGRAREIETFAMIMRTIGLALVPITLVFVQPDAGTALVYISILASVLFVAGTRWLHLAIVGGVALLAVLSVLWLLPAAGVNVLKPYQAQRLTGFIHPSNNPNDQTSYNLRESKIAVGDGGLRGRGVEGATQTALDYLPAHATDFAFASLAEQRGFVGASLLLLLYLLVIWRGLKIVASARDLFCAVAAGGIVFAFLFQIFVNVGMTVGIAPITGIPLPFVSVGGSSMISNLLGMGILLGIRMRSGRRGY